MTRTDTYHIIAAMPPDLRWELSEVPREQATLLAADVMLTALACLSGWLEDAPPTRDGLIECVDHAKTLLNIGVFNDQDIAAEGNDILDELAAMARRHGVDV